MRGEPITVSETGTGTETSRMRLRNDEDEIAHLVCCRDPHWEKGLCGAPSDEINLSATVICTMCIEEAERRRPGALWEDSTRCPMDGRPCPPPHEVDLRVLREVTP